MEGGRGVSHSKEHNSGFVKSAVGDEGSLPLVALLDLDIVISPSYIELCKDLSFFKFVNKVGDQGKGVCISDSVAVEISVVLTGSETSIFLLDKEEEGCLGGF